jgi:hypothetical protein
MTSRKRKNKKSKIIPENKRERAKFWRGRKRKLNCRKLRVFVGERKINFLLSCDHIKKTKVLRLNKINGSNLV